MMQFLLRLNYLWSTYCLGSFRYIICYIHFQFIFNLLSCSLVIWPLLLSLQLYYDKITNLTMSRSDSVLFKQALVSLATDSGLHPLVPYFTYFIADEVKSFYYIIDMTDREIYSNLLLIPSVICPIILGISWFKWLFSSLGFDACCAESPSKSSCSHRTLCKFTSNLLDVFANYVYWD